MENQQPTVVFDQERAASYDQSWAKLKPTREALDLLIHILLSELPAEARILCVGVGTGSELITLAEAFPEWRFTAVEPAAPMLTICRRRVEEAGFSSRCTFHEGYLDSLALPAPDASDAEGFDAATCLLVSHFLTQPEERRGLFQQIASRLRPRGYLISADIAYDQASSAYQSLLAIWLRMLRVAGFPAEEAEKMCASLGREVSLLPPEKVTAMIASAGFDTPVVVYQSLLIHAWCSRRASLD